MRWKSHVRFGSGEKPEIVSKAYLLTSIETYQNIYPCRIVIMSTKETKEQKLKDRYLPDYPVIYEDYVCEESMFIDSVRPHNSNLDSLGADCASC